MKSFSVLPNHFLDLKEKLSINLKEKLKPQGRYAKLYRTKEWKALRKWKLYQNSLCEKCLRYGRISRAYCVDHIKPHRGNWTLFIDANNLQVMCRTCHAKKSQGEKNAYY